MISINKFATLISVLMLLNACSMATQTPLSKDMARVTLLDFDHVTVCIKGKRKTYSVGFGNRTVSLPSGSRATLFYENRQTSYMPYTHFSCKSHLSFLPQANQNYIASFAIVSNKCFMEIVKEDTSNITNIAYDDTVRKAEKCRVRNGVRDDDNDF